MNSEWIIMAGVTLSTAMFAIGGTGYKWIRRYILPLTLALAALSLGAIWWKVIIVTCCLSGALHLGYGDSLPHAFRWVLRALIISAYFAPFLLYSLLLGGIMTLTGTILLTFMFWTSIKGWLTWKLWELTTGFMIGLALIMAVLHG